MAQDYYTNHKKYSAEDKDRSDPRSKEVSCNFFLQLDPKFTLATPLSDQPEMYKLYDYTIIYGQRPYTVECEHKLGWTSSDGTFYVSGRLRPTVDVSGRKWQSTADAFVMLNTDFTALCLTDMKNVLAAPMSKKNTRVGTKDELFFNVPLDKFKFYFLSGGTWELA
jgi:hypothetical protein